MVAILVIIYRTIHTVDLGNEFDESNPYMKFGRNGVINNVSTSANRQMVAILAAILVVVHPTKPPYTNLRKSLIQLIHKFGRNWVIND